MNPGTKGAGQYGPSHFRRSRRREMTRSARVRKWIGTVVVVAVVSGTMIVSPLLEHPVCAQQSWAPPQGWAPPPAGAPAYAPPPVDAARAVLEATQDAQA